MPFSFTQLAPDLANGTAGFAAFDNDTASGDMIRAVFQFKFDSGDVVEREVLRAAAKALLAKAANEL